MKTTLSRAWICPVFLVFLVTLPSIRAVDPIDFLESLKDDEDTQPKETSSTEYPNGVNVIPGEAEVNYPVYSSIPKSSFSCIGRPVGFYADTELRCQVWHICDEDRRQQSFLCTNGTVYSQEKRVCDWWYNVNCDPEEVSRNYLQNHELYKGPPPKSEYENDQEGNNKGNNNNNSNNNYEGNNKNVDRNDFDYQPTTKSYNKDPFSQFPSSRKAAESQQKPRFNANNDGQQYTKPPPSYNEAFPDREASFPDSSKSNDFPNPRRQPSQTRPPTTTSTTTYRPPTTYATPPPPAALQGNSFPTQRPSQQPQQRSHHHHQQQKPQQQQQNKQPTPSRTQPSIKTDVVGGKRIVEIRVPISQIPPEILAKYGKRIPEHILKEIFLNFTRGQQQELQKEAIHSAKASNPTGAGNSRSPSPSAPIPQNRQFSSPPSSPSNSQNRQFSSSPSNSQNRQFNSSPASQSKPAGPPPPPPAPPKKPVDFGHTPNTKSAHSPPPPPPPPAEPQQKFRHSTPRKVDNVKFATPTRELLAEYDDERQQVGESQNPIYSLQQLFSGQHSRTSAKSKAHLANEVPSPRIKDSFDSFNYEPSPSSSTLPPYQEFTRAQPRRRTQAPTTTTTTTTEEPQLITDRYVPVSSQEEKRNAEIRRIFLFAKQGIKVLPPIPVLSGVDAPIELPTARRQPPPLPVTQRPKVLRTTAVPDFSRIPPLPKVSIPDDYYVKNERFEEAESRYPRPSIPPSYTEPQFQSRQYSRQTTTTAASTTTTSTTTYRPPPPPTPSYQDLEFRRTKPNKPQQSKKKPLPPPEEKKQQESSSDYDDGSAQDKVNTDELELLRLAQEYIELTGQDFGVRKTPRNA